MRGMKWLPALGLAATAPAQDAPLDLGTDKIERTSLGNCTKDATVIVPTAYVLVAAQSYAYAGAGNASVSSAMGVEGLDRTMLQGLARQVQEDLMTRLRADGYTVQGWEAMQASVAGAGRLKPDARFGLPVQRDQSWMKADFLVAAPSDEQALDATFSFLARSALSKSYALKSTVLVPILSFTLQRATREMHTGAVDTASVTLRPEMRLHYAQLWGSTSKGAGCSLIIGDTMRRIVAADFGTLERLPSRKGQLDAVLHLDKPAFQAAVMRTARAVNTMSATELQRR